MPGDATEYRQQELEYDNTQLRLELAALQRARATADHIERLEAENRRLRLRIRAARRAAGHEC